MIVKDCTGIIFRNTEEEWMKFKINKMELLLWLVLLPYLKPYNVSLIPALNIFYNYWKFTVTCVVVFIFVCRRTRLSKSSKWVIGFSGIWSISMLINNGTLGDNLQIILSILGLALTFDIIRRDEKCVKYLLKVVSIIAKIYIVLNTITVITQNPILAKPEISYLKFFLGGDNYWAFILIPLCGIMFANDLYLINKCRISTWIFALIGWFDLLYQFSVSGMIAYGILLFTVLFMNYKIIRDFLKLKNVLIIICVILVSVVYVNISNILATFLAMLGKIGFNSREQIWAMAIKAMQSKFILGYGFLTETQVNSYILYGTDHAHNVLLDPLFFTGIVGTFFYFGWIYNAIKFDKKKHLKKYVIVLLMTLSIIFLNGIFDYYLGLIYIYLLIFTIELAKNVSLQKQNSNIN